MKKRFLVLTLAVLMMAGAVLAASEALPAAHFAERFPDQYASFLRNSENSEVTDYVAAHPQIAVLYEGSGFGYSYYSPRGHEYTLEDVKNIGRPHPVANCLTCKSGDYTAMVNAMGEAAYALPFDETFDKLAGGISCYDCHGNEPPKLQVTHQYLADAIPAEDGVKPATLACAQCHVEYYFPKDSQATTLAYRSLADASPREIYARYEELGFTDFVNPRTGSQMVKVQHPEFETYTGQGSVHAGMFSCADCHMGKAENAAGGRYSSHYLVSPLDSPAIGETCAACHQDLSGFVKGIQEGMEARTYQIADKLVVLTNALADKVADGASDEELAVLRALNREAQFYWDFVFVENSEGAHNSKLSKACLDTSEALCDAALAMLEL